MNFERLFIVTYARSGSTLLQGILNSTPGVCIRGENAGALAPLVQSFNSAERAKTKFGQWGHAPENPWYGAGQMDLDSYGRGLVKTFEESILRPPSDARVIGFKEVRYSLMGEEYFLDFIAFIRRFFKNPAFIVNTRNPADTIASAERSGAGMTADEFYRVDAMLKAFAGSKERDVFHVRYDDYAQDAAALRLLFEFLGAPFDQCAIKAVLEKKHSTFTKSPEMHT